MSLHEFAISLRGGVKTAKRVLIIGHGECGDGYGSAIALSEALRTWNVSHRILLPGNVSPFGPALFDMSNVIFNPNDVDISKYDCIVLVDTAEPALTGMAARLNRYISEKNADVYVLDHHACNTGYGHVFYVDGTAPATAFLVHELFSMWNMPITPTIADALLLGLYFDTGIFHHGNTTGDCLRLALNLRAHGARHALIVELLSARTKPIETYVLLANGLRTAWVDDDGLLVVPVTTEPVDERIEQSLGGLSNVLNKHIRYSNSIKGVLVLRGDKVDADGKPFATGSLRTTCADVDVAEIAKRYGGGGHAKAAGFKKDGQLRIGDSSWSAG